MPDARKGEDLRKEDVRVLFTGPGGPPAPEQFTAQRVRYGLAPTATQHGGQETTLFSIIANLLHFGMVVVGLDYGHAGQMTLAEIHRRLALRGYADHRR